MRHVPIKLDGVKEGLYEIYENGKIWSNYKNNFLNFKQDKDGYLEITLSGGTRNKHKTYKVHTLVALHFIGNPPKTIVDPTVNHIDNNKHNNLYTNLEWMERSKNSSIRSKKGIGSTNHEAILTELQVEEICNLLINTNLSIQEIANKYSVHKTTISHIQRKTNWTHITKNYDFSCRTTIRDADGRFKTLNRNLITKQND